MGSRELIVLGTASMLPTRYRAHNSYALRFDDQLILFDPGEGAQRGYTHAGLSIAKTTAVCVTHFHGDHCLGLPGVIQRRSMENTTNNSDLGELPIWYPADGQPYFDRLRHASIFHDDSRVRPEPISAAGVVGQLGAFTLRVAALDHRDTTYGYRIDEPDGWSVDRDKLAEFGLAGPDVGRLVRDGWIDTPTGRVERSQVSVPRRGQSVAFIMDTVPCDGAAELADGVDLLICESTYLHSEVELARRYKHMTARQAAELATSAGARRLVLTHFSARYPDNQVFADEASAFHGDVVAAEDLAVIPVPQR